MASMQYQQEGGGSSLAVKSNEYKNHFDHDTDMLRVHAKTANLAANVMKKEQGRIERKKQKAHSKELPTCIDNYNQMFMDLKDALREMEQLVAESGFADRKFKRTQSLNSPNKQMSASCNQCDKKDGEIRQLKEKLKSTSEDKRIAYLEYDKKIKQEENARDDLRKANFEFDKKIKQQEESNVYKNQCDHDTDMLRVHAKKAKLAADVMKKEQKRIERKSKKAHSKELPECIEKYNNSFTDLKDALREMGELAAESGFDEQKLKRAHSLHVPKKHMSTCSQCVKKADEIKQLKEQLKSPDRKRNENEENFRPVFRSQDELQQQYEPEIKQRKGVEDRYRVENPPQSHQEMPTKFNRTRALSWNEQRHGKQRLKLEETFDHLNTECMKCNSKDTNIRELEDNLERVKKANLEFDERIKQHEYSVNQARQANEKLQHQNETERQQRGHYERMYQEEKAAKDDALRRLSSLASSKLRDNNPNITDLSDHNRPTKIAEKMSELYDNQWTDAYDALEKQRLGERQIIKTLLDTLMTVYSECGKLARVGFFERVQRCIEIPVELNRQAVSQVVLPDQLKQQVKEFRKSRAPVVVEEIKMVMKERIRTEYKHLVEIQMYLSSCIEIGWLCVVQDPPLVLKAQASDKFDTNIFKDYTKRGKYIEFVVWPALYLHDEGALLAKGVAQGSDHAQSSINKTSRSSPIGTSPQSKQNQSPIQNIQIPRSYPSDGKTVQHTANVQTIHVLSDRQRQQHSGQTSSRQPATRSHSTPI